MTCGKSLQQYCGELIRFRDVICLVVQTRQQPQLNLEMAAKVSRRLVLALVLLLAQLPEQPPRLRLASQHRLFLQDTEPTPAQSGDGRKSQSAAGACVGSPVGAAAGTAPRLRFSLPASCKHRANPSSIWRWPQKSVGGWCLRWFSCWRSCRNNPSASVSLPASCKHRANPSSIWRWPQKSVGGWCLRWFSCWRSCRNSPSASVSFSTSPVKFQTGCQPQLNLEMAAKVSRRLVLALVLLLAQLPEQPLGFG